MKPTLDEEAASLHETYLSYLNAGFTVDQAMDLVKARLQHQAILDNMEDDDGARPEE